MAINNQALPQMSNNTTDQMLQFFQRYYPGMQFFRVMNLRDFPITYDWELLMHYLKGAAGPFIRTKVYMDLGVDFTLKAMDFEDEDDGEAAEQLVTNDFHDRNVLQTCMMHDTFTRILGRSCIIETLNGDGSLYQDKKRGVTGFDCVNPMTLTYNSIQDVMNDNTGTKQFVQMGDETIKFDQDRVIYTTNNDLSNRSIMGNSDLANSITDLRELAKFPYYRGRWADNVSNAYNITTIDAQKLKDQAGELSKAIFETKDVTQEFLDATSAFMTQQRRNGEDISVFDYMTVAPYSWAGKTPDITQAELDTVRSIGFKQEIPIELLGMGTDQVNRATLDTINDVFIAKSESGMRKKVFTPILEGLAKRTLLHNDITEGYLKVAYNPFLSENLLEMAQILALLWPTGAISKPTVLEKMGFDTIPDMGGKFWEDKNPLPEATAMPNGNILSAPNGAANVQKSVQKMLFENNIFKKV